MMVIKKISKLVLFILIIISVYQDYSFGKKVSTVQKKSAKKKASRKSKVVKSKKKKLKSPKRFKVTKKKHRPRKPKRLLKRPKKAKKSLKKKKVTSKKSNRKNSKIYLKPRMTGHNLPTPTERTFAILDVDRTSSPLMGGGQELRVSLTGDIINRVASNLGLFAGVPTIGHYRGDGYNLRKRLALVSLPLDRMNRYLPENVLNVLVGVQGLYAEKFGRFQSEVQQKNIKVYFMMHGMVENLDQDNNSHNMVYHPWVASWSPTRHQAPNIEMGIFDAHGVAPLNGASDMPFNRLEARNVSTHPVATPVGYEQLDAMSPDNARFAITPDTPIATFWSVARTQDREHVIIVFHVLALNQAGEQLLQNRANDAITDLGQRDLAYNRLLDRLGINSVPRA